MFILLLESAVHNLRTSKFAFLCKAKTLLIKYCTSENIANSTHYVSDPKIVTNAVFSNNQLSNNPTKKITNASNTAVQCVHNSEINFYFLFFL